VGRIISIPVQYSIHDQQEIPRLFPDIPAFRDIPGLSAHHTHKYIQSLNDAIMLMMMDDFTTDLGRFIIDII